MGQVQGVTIKIPTPGRTATFFRPATFFLPFNQVQIEQIGLIGGKAERHVDRLFVVLAERVGFFVLASIEIICRQAESQNIGYQWAHQEQVGLLGITELLMLLQETVCSDRAHPISYAKRLFGNDVDHAADGVRAVQR
ncbi:hypothetical protein D3C81_1165640 [compost metagenome]